MYKHIFLSSLLLVGSTNCMWSWITGGKDESSSSLSVTVGDVTHSWDNDTGVSAVNNNPTVSDTVIMERIDSTISDYNSQQDTSTTTTSSEPVSSSDITITSAPDNLNECRPFEGMEQK